MTRPSPPETCAQCGATLPRSARACPECGADERTGWRETSIYDGLDLPDEAFDEHSEPSSHRAHPRSGIKGYWVAAAALLVLLLVLAAMGLR